RRSPSGPGGRASGENFGAAVGLERVTFAAARNHVAEGIAAAVNPGNHVVEAARSWAEPAGTVEAEAALARVDGFAQRARLQEIHLFEIDLAGNVAAAAMARISLSKRTSTRWPVRLHSAG